MTLSAESLACVRGDRLVFRGLNFRLAPGGALLLIGPNGSGKSSLLRLVAGLLSPAGGRLLWNGRPVADDPDAHRARLAYVGHLDAVKPVFSVRDSLGFWARLGGADLGAVDEALESFGLVDLADMPGRFLSAGQKRRVNLARLALGGAALWLLDEPTTALDRAATAALVALVARHRGRGGMILAATHIDIGIAGAETLDMADLAA
jgi:heme exporter protein A